MNRLLPIIDEMDTIVDSRCTFSETPMVKNFLLLSEKDKLQVLADLVRQTILYSETPNPDFELKTLIGDDYTSSKVFINYVKFLGLYNDVRLAIGGSRKGIDLDGYNTSHFVVVVRDLNNKEYLVDTTPDIGYSFGEVKRKEDSNIYTYLTYVDEELDEIIYVIRKSMYEISKGLYRQGHIELYNCYKRLFDRECFNGLLLKFYDIVDKSSFFQLKNILEKEYGSKIKRLKELNIMNQEHKKRIINRWEEQLKFLLSHSKDNRAQQRIAQRIVGERKNSLTLNINGQNIKLNNITPRLFWELGCNVVLIKPSSFAVGVSASVTEYMIPDRSKIITSYDANLGAPSELGLKPMSYFHPHGMKYEQQMFGTSRIILIQDNAKKLNDRKHFIRETFVQKIAGHYVNWFDGSKMLWDPSLNTNMVHSTDDANETSIHFLTDYPEYQVFTRYNYPNPILRKEKK